MQTAACGVRAQRWDAKGAANMWHRPEETTKPPGSLVGGFDNLVSRYFLPVRTRILDNYSLYFVRADPNLSHRAD